MKTGTIFAILVLLIIIYLIYDQSQVKKDNSTDTSTPTPTNTSDTQTQRKEVAKEKKSEDDYQMVDVNVQVNAPYTCIVADIYGRQLKLTSQTNSLAFQQICSGYQPFRYSSYTYWSPNWRGWSKWGGIDRWIGDNWGVWEGTKLA